MWQSMIEPHPQCCDMSGEGTAWTSGQQTAGMVDGFSIFNDVSHSGMVRQTQHAGLAGSLKREECHSDVSALQTRKQGSLSNRETD